MILLPETEAEAAAMIRDAAAKNTRLALGGNGTRAGFGNAFLADAILRSTQLSGIVDYDPAEMVMSAQAGTPLAAIEAALAQNRQMLAFEPMDHRPVMGTQGEPTIGGVFAANVAGPRRFVSGAARDSLLGLRFVNGEGEVLRAGGRVMKNVTGLDLVKLLAGSHGTLGFITEVTFRVLPVPQTAATVVLSDLEDAEAAQAMAAAMALSVEVSGSAHLPPSVKTRFLAGGLPGYAATALRIEGPAEAVSLRAERLVAALEDYGPVTRLGAQETATLWREIRDVHPYADSTTRPLWRVSVAPSAGHQLVAALRLEAGIDTFYDWQGGLVWMRMEAEPEGELLRRAIRATGGGHATLLRASAQARATTSAFEPEAPALAALSARVKAMLDPANIFSPGKMGGF
ncbi:FAD-binding protein [Mesorhizobium sp. RP14(2022)]|uniref:FAD-binding protein n=1 Tax=Mesorhizobium liriopis TaxID=2953882 RepID=A0ABT1C2P6_9HYPH|nr:FAD-binding protein [Mesorhizobium liriopis]MCO6049090.1 FAD-binding protein [Mesorhizobium liriopis]